MSTLGPFTKDSLSFTVIKTTLKRGSKCLIAPSFFFIILKPNHLVLEKGLSDIFLFYESNKVIKDFFIEITFF